MTGTGKWRQPEVPHKGWRCIHVTDLGDVLAICEMCEVREIRFVHYMEHPQYPDSPLHCGCICAEYMEGDYVEPKRREMRLRAASRRQKGWLRRHWNLSAKDNPYLRTNGYVITIFPQSGHWSSSITDTRNDKTYFSRRPYDSEDAAKLGALNGMIFLEEKRKKGW